MLIFLLKKNILLLILIITNIQKDLIYLKTWVKNITNFKITDGLEKLIEKVKQKNDRKIRILIRPSGTEPVLRVLVEGEDDSLFDDILDQIEKKIKEL